MTNQARKALATFTAMCSYEECPYNVSLPTAQWVKVARALSKSGNHSSAYVATVRLMNGRDMTYTKVVKLNDGSLVLA